MCCVVMMCVVVCVLCCYDVCCCVCVVLFCCVLCELFDHRLNFVFYNHNIYTLHEESFQSVRNIRVHICNCCLV